MGLIDDSQSRKGSATAKLDIEAGVKIFNQADCYANYVNCNMFAALILFQIYNLSAVLGFSKME